MMRKKNLVLILLLTFTIVIIVFVRFIIKRDTLETQKNRLEFFTDYLDIQFNFVVNTYQQSANFSFFEFSKDQTIIPLLEQFSSTNTDENNKIEKTINEHIKLLNESLVLNGISSIKFSHFNANYSSIKTDSLKHSCISYQNIIEQLKEFKDKSQINGFHICSNSIEYKYIYPCYNTKNTIIGFFEVNYDFHLIKEFISKVTHNRNIGIIYFPNENKVVESNFPATQFNTSTKYPNIFIDHEFVIPPEFERNTKIWESILKNVKEESITTSTNKKFSVFLNTKNDVSIITFRELELLNKAGSVFIASINNDHVLAKTKELNNAIFIINAIIIFLGMFGITYLFLNRLIILQQKQKIQKSEQKLFELNQSKDKFFSILAHDLKNPFNGIIGMSGYLSMEYDNVDDDEKKEIINDINISSKNAFNLLQNLLEWTRTQSGTIKNVPGIIDPMKTIEFSLETVTNLAKIKQIEIKKTIATDATGWADENLVTTVIRNLATNAIKFSPRGSTIEITVKDFEKELVFSVSDKGIGLSDNEVDKLFRIDINFHKTGTEKEIGSGLGLKLCKEFVDYCKGRIWVISDPDGNSGRKGSTFYFTIPKYIIQKSTFNN